jgi:membrane associated rhomboid family serine protease
MLITHGLIGLNVAISILAFFGMRKVRTMHYFLFMPFEVSRGRNLIGAGLSNFSHADGWHLIFNMMTLFYFGPVVEEFLGIHILSVYGLAGLVALLLILILRRNNPQYRVLGASGAITGILFAAIVLKPEMSIYFMILPIPIPAPVFALIYIAYSTFLLDGEVGNVAHEAHIGGGLSGFIIAGLLSPTGFSQVVERIHRLMP